MNNSRKAKLLSWKQYYSAIVYRHVDKIKSRYCLKWYIILSNTAQRGGKGATKTEEQSRKE
jgi:hypothetical protein